MRVVSLSDHLLTERLLTKYATDVYNVEWWFSQIDLNFFQF